jgi:serine/threonine protein kinase
VDKNQSGYAIGQRLPGTIYRVEAAIASGGMGSVYEVTDETIGKRYVVKTLLAAHVGRKDLARRMEAEARALARLHHPNIVDVITAGTLADAQPVPYIVMERLVGMTLRAVLDRRGKLGIDEVIRLGIDLMDALDHAHQHRILHRDVKPENVFLHRATATSPVITKLLDFGIVRIMEDDALRETRGRFIGTLKYAAPEQINNRDLGPTVDLYSSALLMYELATGKGPFDGIVGNLSSLQQSHVPDRIDKHVECSEQLATLIFHMLEKEPGARPQTAAEVRDELIQIWRGGKPKRSAFADTRLSAESQPAMIAPGSTQISPADSARTALDPASAASFGQQTSAHRPTAPESPSIQLSSPALDQDLAATFKREPVTAVRPGSEALGSSPSPSHTPHGFPHADYQAVSATGQALPTPAMNTQGLASPAHAPQGPAVHGGSPPMAVPNTAQIPTHRVGLGRPSVPAQAAPQPLASPMQRAAHAAIAARTLRVDLPQSKAVTLGLQGAPSAPRGPTTAPNPTSNKGQAPGKNNLGVKLHHWAAFFAGLGMFVVAATRFGTHAAATSPPKATESSNRKDGLSTAAPVTSQVGSVGSSAILAPPASPSAGASTAAPSVPTLVSSNAKVETKGLVDHRPDTATKNGTATKTKPATVATQAKTPKAKSSLPGLDF